ncbi:MAG: hypothetical protein ACXVZ4_00355 [Gaiellaceae bacterium]
MSRIPRLVPVLLAWWALLFWLWLLLVGEWNSIEWTAAAVAGLVAAVAAGVVHRLGLLRFRFRAGWLAPVPRVLWQVVVDFGILVHVLVRTLARRQAPRGVFRAVPFDAGPAGGELAAGRRAVVALLATYSPNCYVVDVDSEQKLALVHDLVPRRSSESPL